MRLGPKVQLYASVGFKLTNFAILRKMWYLTGLMSTILSVNKFQRGVHIFIGTKRINFRFLSQSTHPLLKTSMLNEKFTRKTNS